MTAEERIAQLEMELARERAKTARVEAERASERAENAWLRQQMERILARLREVEGQLAKDSHTSLKPPSSDGPGRKPRSQRHRSEKQTGGQPGHAGRTLMQVATPDEVVRHRPAVCCHCQQPLEGVPGSLKERAPACMTCQRCACGYKSIKWRRSVAQLVSRPVGGAFQQGWRLRCSMGRTCAP